MSERRRQNSSRFSLEEVIAEVQNDSDSVDSDLYSSSDTDENDNDSFASSFVQNENQENGWGNDLNSSRESPPEIDSDSDYEPENLSKRTRTIESSDDSDSNTIANTPQVTRVTLWGPPFKGFMMVAAEEGAKDWPAGIFYSEDGAAKRVSCLSRGDTVTHQNSSYKDSVSVLWYGPENMMSEQIQFIATVVVNLTIYYTNIRSGMLRLDPTLHAAGAGAEGAPVAVTMDPWLSGQSVTQAPSLNIWGGAAGGRFGAGAGAAGSSWGNAGASSWGANTQSPSWGSWGANNAATGGSWGSNQGGNTGWSQSGTGAPAGGWGSQSQGGQWGQGQGSNQWGQGGNTAQSGWSQQGSGSQWRNPGSVTPQGGQTANPGAGGQAGATSGTGNTWSNGGDWQQWGQGSVTSSSWKNGQVVWNAPGDGRPIWHWNSGSITTKKPEQTPAPSAADAANSGIPWSASNIMNLLQQFGK